MRTDCKHYRRRTTASGEALESCSLHAAPDAPHACPDLCPLFEEVRLSRAGWTLGSLGPPPPAEADLPAGSEDMFRALEADFDPDTLATIEAEESRKTGRRPSRRRRRRGA